MQISLQLLPFKHSLECDFWLVWFLTKQCHIFSFIVNCLKVFFVITVIFICNSNNNNTTCQNNLSGPDFVWHSIQCTHLGHNITYHTDITITISDMWSADTVRRRIVHSVSLWAWAELISIVVDSSEILFTTNQVFYNWILNLQHRCHQLHSINEILTTKCFQ